MTPSNLPGLAVAWWSWLPHGQILPEPLWLKRHTAIVRLLWVHAAGLFGFGLLAGNGLAASAAVGGLVGIGALCASDSRHSRTIRSLSSAAGACAASAGLVHLSGAYTEMAVHYFVMSAVIALYRDWRPLLANLTLVILHHAFTGLAFSSLAGSQSWASAPLWMPTTLHGGFLATQCIAVLASWRLDESAVDEFRNGQDRFRLMADQSPIGIFQTDHEGHCVYMNGRGRTVTEGITYSALQKQQGISRDRDTPVQTRGTWDEAIHKGQDFEMECRIELPNGAPSWIHLQSRPILGQHGAVIGHTGTIDDITARKEAEDAALLVAQRLELATRVSQIGVWDWNIPTNELVWDDQLCTVYGIRKEDFGGAYEAWQATVHPEDRARSEADIQQALRNEKPFNTEFRILWPDGTVRIIKGEGHVTRDADGVPLRMTGINYDITERRRAEQELEKRAAWQKAILECAGHAIICTRLDGTIETFNPAAERMLGYRAAEVIGRNTLPFFHDPEEVAERAKVFSQELGEPIAPGFDVFVAHTRHDLPNQHEWTYRRKDGTRFPGLLSISAMKLSDGTITGFLGLALDITDAKEASSRLAAQYEIAKMLASRASIEVVMQGIIKSICSCFHWNLGTVWLQTPGESQLHRAYTWHDLAQAGDTYLALTADLTFAHGIGLPGDVWDKGSTSWVADLRQETHLPRTKAFMESGFQSAMAFPLRIATGEVLGVLEFFSRDTHEPDKALLNMLESLGSQIGLFLLNRRAEAQLRKSQALFMNIVDLAHDAVIAVDRSQRMLIYNKGAASIFGYAPEEMLGQPVARLIPERFRASHFAQLEQFFSANNWSGAMMGAGRLITGIRNTGDEFPAEASIGMIDLFGEKVASIVLRDVSEQKTIEAMQARYRETLERDIAERMADLEQAKTAAESASQAKSEFLANMSHELRTPMHAILGFVDLSIEKLERQTLDKIPQYLSCIQSSGTRLLGLLNDLLDLSKLDAGQMRYEMAPHRLPPLVQAAVEQLSPLLLQKSLQTIVCGDDPSILVSCDAVRIGQVLQNLLSNAIKFSPEGGTIRISCSSIRPDAFPRDPENRPIVSVTISDDGIGIPEDELTVVFDKFVQSSKTKTGAGGTGLGLAICQQIVRDHGGEILARNNPGGGTSLTFILPQADLPVLTKPL